MTRANTDGRLFESIDVFAERAFNDFPRDKHIAPQTGWGAEQCWLIAPLERSAEVALPAPLPRVNVTRGECTADAPQIVRGFYADDIAYWTKIRDDFDSKHVSACRSHLDGEARREVEEGIW